MIHFFDLSTQQLLELNSTDIKTYIDRLCAEEGIKILKEPTPPVLDPSTPQPSTIVYEVAGVKTTCVDFANQIESIIQANHMKLVDLDYNWNLGCDLPSELRPAKYLSHSRLAVQGDYYRTKANLVYTKDEYFGPVTRAYNKLSHEYSVDYKADKKEYEEAADRREVIESKVWERVNAARDHASKVYNLEQKFTSYLELANYDRDLAKKFFFKAYGRPAPEIGSVVFPEEYPNCQLGGTK